jgi:hypothetical protein
VLRVKKKKGLIDILDHTTSALLKEWVAAVEKARAEWRIEKCVTVIFHWDSVDAKQSNGRPAKKYFLKKTQLKPSKANEIAIFYKGKDVREGIMQLFQNVPKSADMWDGISYVPEPWQ